MADADSFVTYAIAAHDERFRSLDNALNFLEERFMVVKDSINGISLSIHNVERQLEHVIAQFDKLNARVATCEETHEAMKQKIIDVEKENLETRTRNQFLYNLFSNKVFWGVLILVAAAIDYGHLIAIIKGFVK
jgi:chromosome segregation ATPase